MVCGLLKTVIDHDDRDYTEKNYSWIDFSRCKEVLIPELDDLCKWTLLYFISYLKMALKETSRLAFTQPLQPKESMA